MTRVWGVTAAVVGVLVFAAPARAAGSGPPGLPSVREGSCVGPSDVVADAPSAAHLRLRPEDAWPLTRGAGVLVGVVDTGVSAQAVGLEDAVAPGADVVAGGRADTDCRGRGTALAALVAARPQRQSPLAGVAPEARILPVRVVGADGKVPGGMLAAGLRTAVDRGAGVILVGIGSGIDDGLTGAVSYAVEHDVLVVAAVGDEKDDTAPAWWPARDPDVLAVGGITAAGEATETVTARAGRDLVAPGAGIVTAAPAGPGGYAVGGAGPAAAYVAGAAALLRSYDRTLTAAQVRDRLIATATDGELDVYGAVAAVDPAPARVLDPQAAPPVTLPPRPGPDLAGIVAAGAALCSVAAAALGWVAVRIVAHARRRRRALDPTVGVTGS